MTKRGGDAHGSLPKTDECATGSVRTDPVLRQVREFWRDRDRRKRIDAQKAGCLENTTEEGEGRKPAPLQLHLKL